MIPPTTPPLLDINDRGILLIKGPDAHTFLQGQVTCDIRKLARQNNRSQTTLGAHCTPKGRAIFSFRACELDSTSIALNVHQSVIDTAIAALSKYSVFSNVEIINATEDYRVIGLTEENKHRLATHIGSAPTEINSTCHATDPTITGVLIAITQERYEAWFPKSAVSDWGLALTNGTEQWNSHNIQDGLGDVRADSSELFIPQMLNLQHIGSGISFKKGCYTGQEIIARMEYLGQLKRRLYRFSSQHLPTTATIGSPVYTPSNKDPQCLQTAGNIVNICSTTKELLAVVTVTSADSDAVYLDENGQHKLQQLPLPY